MSSLHTRAERAMTVARRGTEAEVNAFEAEQGCSLSMVLDQLWFEAEEAADYPLARRLEDAYRDLVGAE